MELYTTLEIELERMRGAVATKLASYKPDQHKDLESQIYAIFKSSSRVAVSPLEEEKIRTAIKYALAHNEPVQATFLFAAFWMAGTTYKYIEPNKIYPRLGDYWLYFWLDLIHQKVAKLYAPGCLFTVVEEYPAVAPLGWTHEEASLRGSMLKSVYSRFSSIRVVGLPDFADLPDVTEPGDDEVFAVLLSTPSITRALGEAETQRHSDFLYTSEKKDFTEIRQSVPVEIWSKAKQLRTLMKQKGTARRTSGWLDRLMGNTPYIDGAVTDCARWCPDAWSWAFPQHGGSVLDTSAPNRFSISVVPEHRLVHTHTPVKLKVGDSDEYILYWRSNTSVHAALVTRAPSHAMH